MLRAIFLIDGEHYPPVVLDAIRSVEESLGAEGVAAAFLGGTEKLKEGTDYGVPLVHADDPVSGGRTRRSARYAADVVVDLSDEPVVGYRERMRIASAALAAGRVTLVRISRCARRSSTRSPRNRRWR